MTKTIDITMNEEMAAEIEKRAAAVRLSASKYIQLVLMDRLERCESLPTS